MVFMKHVIREVIVFTVFAFVFILPFRFFVAQPFIVEGASMSPTFETGNYLVVDQLSYDFTTPKRGEVVVFRHPKNPAIFLIKRVIGLPNETVLINGDTVQIERPGQQTLILDEPYVKNMGTDFGTHRFVLGKDEYFVMGDNRPKSSDSRIWGPLPKKNIVGRVLLRLLPANEVGIFPGKYYGTQ